MPSPESSILDSSLPADFLEGYHPQPTVYDHLLDERLEIRPHWQPMVTQLRSLGAAGIHERWALARRLIHDNGVTYNVYGDPRGMERPWELDALPNLISSQEWSGLEAGLQQRAQLLDLILQDLYGPQRLLEEGLLPFALVLGHPGYLRACHGLQSPRRRMLHFHACDLGRGPEGGYFVLGDRTQAPSGAGYVLENRIVLSRVFPEAFRDSQVHRLATFFRVMRETLAGLAPSRRENPRIVILTPGPLNETYFEQAYLARYLGYALVEGGDLTVRDQHVYLKTLGGLQRIDVILRRQDDDFCDPLELRSDSTLGIPGLVEAARVGNVAIANALGSGWAETPALMAYLPRLCRYFLNEELRLDSIPTWWCGEPQGLQYTLDHLPELVIKAAYPRVGKNPVFAASLTEAQQRELAERIRSRPEDYVAQRQMPLATGPVLAGRRLEPRRMTLRTYLCGRQDGYAVMPGGLTRVGSAVDALVVSMQSGGGSKDTWVLSEQPVSSFSLLPASTDLVPLHRGGGDLPSRTADNLFWLGRHFERTEAAVRHMRAICARLVERPEESASPELPCLLKAIAHIHGIESGFVGPNAQAELAHPEEILRRMVFDDKLTGSIRYNISAMRRVASIARDRLSTDAWRIFISLVQEFDDAALPAQANPAQLLDLMHRAVMPLSAFTGLIMESMTRGTGWTFLSLGRRIERALQTTHLLRSTLVDPIQPESPQLEAVLEIADSAMTYRRRYLATLQPHAVFDLLLADESNPRSIAFQIACVQQDLAILPGEPEVPAQAPATRIILSLLTTLRIVPIQTLCRQDAQGSRPELDDLLERLQQELPALADAISHTYLSHTALPRQLTLGSQAWPLQEGGSFPGAFGNRM